MHVGNLLRYGESLRMLTSLSTFQNYLHNEQL